MALLGQAYAVVTLPLIYKSLIICYLREVHTPSPTNNPANSQPLKTPFTKAQLSVNQIRTWFAISVHCSPFIAWLPVSLNRLMVKNLPGNIVHPAICFLNRNSCRVRNGQIMYCHKWPVSWVDTKTTAYAWPGKKACRRPVKAAANRCFPTKP